VGYFAFGSNMSSRRLVARVGTIVVVGRAVLPNYRHRFSKRGSDGTGKGNIEPGSGASVHGVLYRLTLGQIEVLTRYEDGYRRRPVQVRTSASLESAWTFIASAPERCIAPAPLYIEHYWAGIREHGIPVSYMNAILEADPE
jgi:hypothetical protein